MTPDLFLAAGESLAARVDQCHTATIRRHAEEQASRLFVRRLDDPTGEQQGLVEQ